MKLYNARLKQLLDKWPGKKTFGVYRFIPMFFVLGGLLEFSMINWRVGEVNFYDTYKKKEALKIIQKRLSEESSKEQEN